MSDSGLHKYCNAGYNVCTSVWLEYKRLKKSIAPIYCFDYVVVIFVAEFGSRLRATTGLLCEWTIKKRTSEYTSGRRVNLSDGAGEEPRRSLAPAPPALPRVRPALPRRTHPPPGRRRCGRTQSGPRPNPGLGAGGASSATLRLAGEPSYYRRFIASIIIIIFFLYKYILFSFDLRSNMQLRTVKDVKVVDIEKRRNPSKHYVYLINVTYSDCTSHIIYRRYSKFFDLQMQILDKFPIEGGQKDPKKRIIPFLPGKILFRRSHVRDVAMKRLRFIDDYCRALVRLPPQISQSEEVLRFFETKAEDLNPPVEDYGKRKSVWMYGLPDSPTKTEASGLDGCEPMVLEQYVVVANYERQENSEISLQAGEVVDVIEKSESGWWFVSTTEEQGWVPATYLDAQNGTRDDLDLGTTRAGEEEKYITVQPYASQGKDEIGFDKGVTVEVIQKNLEGWWYIRYLGKEGWAPASYLKKMKEDFSPRKKTLTGPVEIIGNIMEISNLLNKKSVSEKDVQTDGSDGTPERHISKSEISLPMPCSPEAGAVPAFHPSPGPSTGSSAPVAAAAATSVPEEAKCRTEPGSPAVARVAPHRVEIGSPNLRQKPPPRRETSLGFQLPKPPEPPTVEAEYYTIAEFQSCISDGISFRGGQKADVIEKNSGGWWYVQIGEQEGWAPCSYIDKRKKPNLSRRTSTLTRPKVPPPAPPIKKQEYNEDSPSPMNSASKAPESPSRPVYEEPEYDVPAIGFDPESDTDSLKGECSVELRTNVSSLQKYPSPLRKGSPVVSIKPPPFKVGESLEDICRDECIYENDCFRPPSDEFASAKDSSGIDSDTPKTHSSSTIGRKTHSSSSCGGGKPLRKVPPDLSSSQSLSRAEETSPRSSSDESGRGLRWQQAPKRDGCESRVTQSPLAKPKPVVRPKPQVAKPEAHSTERMDISTLRRQLRPTGTLRHSSLRGARGAGDDSETASVVSSEDSASSRSTSDLSSIYSKGSRGGDSDLESSFYRTTDAYERAQDSEISFPAGVEVEVLERQDSGWWYIRWGHEEGWAPTYFLEPLRHVCEASVPLSETDGPLAELGGGGSNHSSKSNSLEKNEQRVQALNNLNQRRNMPAIPCKPPGGFSKLTTSGGLLNGSGNGGSVRLRNGVRQAAVRPQSVFVSPPQPVKDTNVYNTGSLRRNESMGAADHLRSNTGIRRNSSFNTTRPQAMTDVRVRAVTTSTVTTAAGAPIGAATVQRNGIPVSTVRPKPIEKSQLIHNNLREVYVSIADYRGDEETMGFPEGTSLEVLEKNPNGWWYCQVVDSLQSRKGWVPSNYLERKK
ncbi:SH3 and PX domain-containing protein 2A isoform X3 [Denticeps clupeoides]|nr:SH3 and PX domain-containing protein 2A isoform X3 [Denticeps clupeoides]